jgi:hypothetical protein
MASIRASNSPASTADQGFVNLCVNGDLDQVLPPCCQDLRNPEIHRYLAGIYRLPGKYKKSHALIVIVATSHMPK